MFFLGVVSVPLAVDSVFSLDEGLGRSGGGFFSFHSVVPDFR